MSKNVALILSELVVAIVFATVVPDWECKSAGFIFNMQAPVANILPTFFTTRLNRLINKLLVSWKKLNIFHPCLPQDFKQCKTFPARPIFPFINTKQILHCLNSANTRKQKRCPIHDQTPLRYCDLTLITIHKPHNPPDHPVSIAYRSGCHAALRV
jgi:hypothetical protein